MATFIVLDFILQDVLHTIMATAYIITRWTIFAFRHCLQTFSNANNFWSLWKICGRHIFHISECCIKNIIEDVRKQRIYVGSRRFYIKNLYVKFCQRLIATEFRSKLSNTGSILMVFLYEKVLCNNFRSCVDGLANRQLSIRISSFRLNGVNRCDIVCKKLSRQT